MLKKPGAVLLTMLYVVTVLGFALNLHYCGNNISSVKINAPAVACGMDKVAGKMNCCKDTQLQVKVKDVHQAEETSFLSQILGFELPHLPFGNYSFFPQQPSLEKYFDRAPPDEPVQSIASFIKNCIFRI